MATTQSPPFPILKRGYGRFRDVRRANILIVGKVSDAIKPLLGPNGMNKMLVSPTGEVVTTNHGREIMEKIEIINPVTRLLVDEARTQDEIAGDGTKTAVVLTGELLKKADLLLKMRVHPTAIIGGYHKAARRALKVLESGAVSIRIDDGGRLKNIIKTAMGGRITGPTKDQLAGFAVRAIRGVAEERSGSRSIVVDPDRIGIRKKAGGSVSDSELVSGLIIYRGKSSPRIQKLEDVKIALIGSAIDPFIYETGDNLREYMISHPGQLRGAIDSERRFNQGIVEHVKGAGATALFCQKRMSKAIMNTFASAGMLAFDLISEEDILRLSRATGAAVVSKIDELGAGDLGWAELLEFRKIAGDEMLFIEGCRDPKTATVLIRGGTQQVVDEAERIFKESVKAAAVAVEDGKALWGGGAIEMEVAIALKKYSHELPDKEQLAVDAFGDALEEIPKVLAANAGMDPLNAVAELRAGHARGLEALGINAAARRIEDISAEGLLDAFKVKQHAIKIAAETATMILGISDIISVTDPHAIRSAEKMAEDERQRIQGEKLRKAFSENPELREVKKLDREMMERVRNPESF